MAYQKVYMNQIHSSSLLCQLSQMWRGEILCDAFIRTGNITSKAHRVVLVAACPMLQSMDGAAIGSQLEVKLSADIKKDSVTAFLQYLYEGFMMLTEDNVKDVEKIARLLQVDGVIKCCSDFHRNLKKSTGRSVVPDAQLRYTYADQAEFKHVRTSDLLRSMNNTEKRGSEMDDSGRKRFRGGQYSVTDDSLSMMSSYSSLGSDTQRPQQPPRFKQRQVLEDSFELVQTELDTTPGSQGRPLPGRPPTTVSVTVASRVNPDPDVQIVCLPETVEQGARQSSSTSFSPFSPNRSASNFNFGSNLPGSSRKNSTQSIPSPGSTAVPKHVRQVIQSSSSLQNIPRDSSSISSPSMPSPSHLSKSGPSSVLSDDGRSKDADPTDQIVVQPTSLEASQMSTSPLPEFSNANIESVTGGTSLDASSLSPSARKNSQETKPGVAVPSGSFDDPGDSSRHSMAPDLSIVKIERAAEQPSTSSGAQGPDTGGLDMHVEMQGGDIEDYEPIDDDGEEDTSEMEMWNYGDMSGKFANDPANAMYIQGQGKRSKTSQSTQTQTTTATQTAADEDERLKEEVVVVKPQAPVIEIVNDERERAQLLKLKKKSSSRNNFAWNLCKRFFSFDELQGHNTSGACGKKKLDVKKLAKVRQMTNMYYPIPDEEEEATEWKPCLNAINTGIRNTFYKIRVKERVVKKYQW